MRKPAHRRRRAVIIGLPKVHKPILRVAVIRRINDKTMIPAGCARRTNSEKRQPYVVRRLRHRCSACATHHLHIRRRAHSHQIDIIGVKIKIAA